MGSSCSSARSALLLVAVVCEFDGVAELDDFEEGGETRSCSLKQACRTAVTVSRAPPTATFHHVFSSWRFWTRVDDAASLMSFIGTFGVGRSWIWECRRGGRVGMSVGEAKSVSIRAQTQVEKSISQRSTLSHFDRNPQRRKNPKRTHIVGHTQ